MAILRNDYFERIRTRRFDEESGNYDLSESFKNTQLSQGTRYIYESMRPIDDKYRKITQGAIEAVEKHINRNWPSLTNAIDIKRQGSVTTFTEIEATSDADLLIIQNEYSWCNGYKADSTYQGSTSQLMTTWKKEIAEFLDTKYNSIKEKEKCVLINMQNPKRKIDVVPASWYLKKWQGKDTDAGVATYKNGIKNNFSFPFRVTKNINLQGNQKGDSNRRAIRYLKSLKSDSEGQIDLSSFEIYSFINDIINEIPYGSNGTVLSAFLLGQIDTYLKHFKDSEQILSPCSTESPFKNRRPHFERNFRLLSEGIQQLHNDAQNDVYHTPRLFEKGILYG